MTDYTLHKGQYISDIMDEIPTNCILSKRIPGCGATTLELETDRNSIIIVPNVPVIISKCKKHKNLRGVLEKVTANDISEYIKSNERYKIMTTPESFGKVKTACERNEIDIYSNFFLLIDECQQLIKDVDYRDDIVLPMDDFFMFKNKALVSATPLEFSDPRFSENNFKTLYINADYDYRQDITVIHTYNILTSVERYIRENTGTVCFFVNSVNTILALMKQLKILKESSVYCAVKSCTKLKNEFDFNNCYSEWSAETMKKYNFFTGRFFTAFDLDLDYKPDLVIISDPINYSYTIVDVETDCIQICGRFRNGIKSATHIYRSNPNIICKSKELVEWEISAHEFAYQTINTFYNSADTKEARWAFGQALEVLPYTKYLYADFTKNYFAIDKEINLTLVTNRYQSEESMKAWYHNSYYFNATFESCDYNENDEKLRTINSSRTVKEKRKKMLVLLRELEQPYSEYELDFINDMRQIDSFIVEAFEDIGADKIEELNFNEKKIRNELIMSKRMGNTAVRLIKNSFKVGNHYTNKTIVEELTKIFETLNIHPEKKICAKLINDYFQTVPWRGSKSRGYTLVSNII